MTRDLPISVRPVVAEDRTTWQCLWEAYLTFYETSLPPERSSELWSRLIDPNDPIEGLAAVAESEVIGMVHYFPHPDTWKANPVCYLQDLFVAPTARGRGAGEALIREVQRRCREQGWSGVYWQTAEDNARARSLYDKLTGGPNGFVVYELEV